jgi:hypothetical protein
MEKEEKNLRRNFQNKMETKLLQGEGKKIPRNFRNFSS